MQIAARPSVRMAGADSAIPSCHPAQDSARPCPSSELVQDERLAAGGATSSTWRMNFLFDVGGLVDLVTDMNVHQSLESGMRIP